MQRLIASCTALVAVMPLVIPLNALAAPVVAPAVTAASPTAAPEPSSLQSTTPPPSGPSSGPSSPATAPVAPALAAPALGAYLAGMVAGQEGDSEQAATLLFDALSHDPDAIAVRGPAFLYAAMAGDPRAAELASAPGAGLIGTLVLANQAVLAGDWHKAAGIYSGMSGTTLATVLRPLLLAWALEGDGRTDEALTLLAAVPGNSPLAGAASLEAGSIADYAGKVAAAATLYRTTQAMFPSIGLGSVQLMGGYLARNGHPADAADMVHMLAQRVPIIGMIEPGLVRSLDRPVISSPAQGLARAYMAIGLAMLEQEARADGAGNQGNDPRRRGGDDHESARFMLRFALDLDPGLTAARLSLVDLLAADHPNAALRLLDRVPAGDPLFPLVTLRAATLLAATGQTAESLDRLHALTAALPDRPEPWQTLGDVLSDAKRFGEAIPAYDRAIADRRKLNNGQLSGDDWQLLFARAVAFDRQNQWPKARADLDHALALSPTEPFLLNYLGYSLVERNQDLSQAKALIRRALDAKPDDGAIRDSLGWVMLHQGDVPGAVQTLEQAAEQTPEDPTVNFHLGAAYWAAGRRTEAQDQWRWALVLGPEPDDAAKIRDALQKAADAPAPKPAASPIPAAPPMPADGAKP